MSDNRKRCLIAALLLLFFAAALPAIFEGKACAQEHSQADNVGLSFSSLRDAADHYEHQGYLLLGRFENAQWPATVIYEKEGFNEINFVLKNGSPHSYPGYTGYLLKAVALEDEFGEETMLVFRSVKKADAR